MCFPPLVSLFGLFPILNFDYDFRPAVCINYPLYLRPVCSVSVYLIYMLFPVFLCIYPALSTLKTVILSYILVSLFLPAVCTVTSYRL